VPSFQSGREKPNLDLEWDGDRDRVAEWDLPEQVPASNIDQQRCQETDRDVDQTETTINTCGNLELFIASGTLVWSPPSMYGGHAGAATWAEEAEVAGRPHFASVLATACGSVPC